MEPLVVLGDAAVANFAVAALHEPGDATFDHRALLPVGLLERVSVGVAAGGPQERVVFGDVQRPAASGGGASLA